MELDRPRAASRLLGAAPYLALAIVLAAVFADPLFTGRTFFYRDLGFAMRPSQLESRTAPGGGTDLLPLWSHAASNGRTLLANPSNALLQPLDLLYAIFPFSTAFNLFLVLHVVLAGWGMVFCARRLGCGPKAAFAAGAAYALGGGIFSALNLYWTLVAAAWAPFVAAAGVNAVLAPSTRTVALLALCFGLAASGGQPEVLAATTLVGGLVSLTRAPGSPATRLARAAWVWAAGIAGGLAIAAAQLIPAALHARTTLRGLGFTTEGILFNSLHPWRALWLVVPRMGGNPLDSLRPGGFPGVALLDGTSPYLLSIYVGATVAAAAIAGLVAARRRPGSRALAFTLAGLSLAGVVTALGRFLPGATELVAHLPFGLPFRFPEKALFVTFLAVPLLAAIGIEVMRATAARQLAWFAAAAIVLDLAFVHRGYAPTIALDDLATPPLARELHARSQALGVPDGAWRIHHERERAASWGPPAGSIEPREDEYLSWQVRMLMPTTAPPYGIRAAMELEGDLLDDVRYFGLVRSAYGGEPGVWPRALGEAGVLWVVSPKADLEQTTAGELIHERTLGAAEGVAEGSGHLYRNTRFVPRVRVAGSYAVVPTPALRDLTPLANARYAEDAPWPPEPVLESAPDPSPAAPATDVGQVESIREDHRGVKFTVRADTAGVAIVSDAVGALDAWTVTVDGAAAPLWRANYAYVAVPVSAGVHQVRLDYRPRGFAAGSALSMLGLVAVGSALVMRRSGSRSAAATITDAASTQ